MMIDFQGVRGEKQKKTSTDGGLLHKCIQVISEQNVEKGLFGNYMWSFICGRHINTLGALNFTKHHNIFKEKGVCESDVHNPKKT